MNARRAALAAAGVLLAASCTRWAVPATVVGAWTGTQQVTVRVRTERGSFRFVSDTVAIAIRVEADGRVAGRVGGATFVESYVLRNRGWFGRLLRIATDYRIEGRLQGAVFAADPIPTKDVHVPFGTAGDTLSGTLLQAQGMGVFPMVELRLTRR
jgi:hypothetical protein